MSIKGSQGSQITKVMCRVGLTLLMTLFAIPSLAHFEQFEPRVVFAGEVEGKLRVFVRMPLGLALLPADWKSIDDVRDLPFLIKHETEDGPTYLVDRDALAASPEKPAQSILAGHRFWIDGQEISQPELGRARIATQNTLPQFSTMKSANSGLPDRFIATETGEIDLFDATLDVEFILADAGANIESFKVVSTLGKDFDTIDRLANVVTFYGAGKPARQTTIGALDITFGDAPEEIGSVINQLLHGAKHIMKGLDHVLIIALIALTASSWVVVLRNATGFTVGHSITLALGAYGFFPSAGWFAPMAEIFIAATILFGAWHIIRERHRSLGLYAVFAIGLVHGVGFSFALEGVLQASGDHALLTLLFFNLGVELGQIAVYLAFLPILLLLDRLAKPREAAWQGAVAVGMMAISAYWVFDRGSDFVGAVL
ncbi:HupE/UreJ family protein [Leisingera sp. SS27]|uniref:HupE/UreJ family protein n=1 Tax=Leisingera sp. SS27 TaxID=2979462 RepID=UPI00232CF7F4|nr:HupE/UreJ family protein [Leisingera sp. SS27]MDC0660547.1 HupE/UreJ family protein [Leisingera sp. SS27]